jgi:hypothetical protein
VGGLAGALEAGGVVKLTWTDPADGDLDHIEITWTNGGTTPVSVAKGIQTWTGGLSDGLTNGTAYTLPLRRWTPWGTKTPGKPLP